MLYNILAVGRYGYLICLISRLNGSNSRCRNSYMKKKFVFLGYCSKCGRDVEIDYCDECQKYVEEQRPKEDQK